ncbi:MAG: nucleotidyltransferase domain-containing protein, partial [Wenzhouxiangellaceae bacterium]|nr:nucleotidyltransferase domain-containing protein [Wenzhouxiangellaceae bacterium]
MRLTNNQIQAIKTAAAEIFGDEAEVWLFGSRIDDDKRGGDIDLYVELPAMDREEMR